MSSTPCPSPSRSTEEKDKDSMWYFSADQLANSPSRQNGITADMELSYRQQTAYLIQEMGQRLQVSQLCINTAIVYMHRFYAFHSFTHFHRNRIAAASLFLAAKVEEQPRKLEHVIKAANKCLNHATSATTDAHYIEQAQDLVFNENVLLQTLGFDVAIDHPHTHVVKTCQLVKACKDLAQTSYFLASNSLHLTSMCLQYKPTVVACFCIYLACKWSRWEIAQSTEGKHWFHYVDETVTMDLLKQLTDEFIAIYEKSPARLKSKLNNIKAIAQRNQTQVKDKKADQDWKMSDMMKMYSPGENQASSSQYTTTSQPSASNDQSQQSGQSIPPAMLPPQSHQPQPIRKTETHRSHHNSSMSSSHHPPKVGYSTGDNVLDHKSNSHKQQQQPMYNSNNLVNRTRDPSSAHTNQNLMFSSKNAVSRSGQMSGNLVGQSIPRTQAHPFDVNLHKARERNLTGVSISAGHGVTSHGMPPRKPDATRSLTKDSSLRVPPEQLSKVAGSNSKVFSTSSTSSLPYAGGQQMHSSTKVDVMHDMCRNVIQGSSRGHSNATANGPTPPAGYHQSQMPRHTNTKHEQPKQMSVHTQQQPQVPLMHHQHPFQQPQQQLQQHHHHHHNKPLIKTEPSFAGSSGANDLSQATQMQPYGNQRSSVEPAHHSDEHVPSQFNAHLAGSGGGSQPQNFVKSTNSLFSPDYVEKSQLQQQSATHQMSLNSSNLNGVTSNSDVYNYKMTSATSGVNAKDSPTKVKMEREQNSRKDKNRNNLVNTEPPAVSRSSNQPATQTFMKNSVAVKSEPSALTLPNELSGTSSYHNMAAAAMKRPNDQLNIKQEDELLRENKMRKMEHMNDMGKHHQVVNGIETNPDLVRNLLKESLCSTSGLLKSQSLAPSLQPPAELLEPSTSAAASQQMNTISTAANMNAPTNNGKGSAMDVDEQGPSGAKAEKKKKKDKHKHKEKDKTKDREERKKHKKDKDRHKEREADGSAEHVKIKISKEKIENAAGEPIGLKIKIPKDIIAGDLTSNPGNLALSNSLTTGDMQATVIHAPQPLKIKISKDKLESYSSGSTNDANNLSNAQHQHGHPKSLLSNYPAYNSTHANLLSTVHGSNSSSSSTNATKRRERDRDRDRERDKEKKRSHDSSVKSGVNSVPQATAAALLTTTGGGHQILPTGNTVAGAPHCFGSAVGGGGVGVGVGVGTGVGSAINATAQRNQYSSKMHHHNNMSQLFGESNDDDDDDDDDY